MRKVLIFGNSGSGKSTLAKELQKYENLSHLDLDTLAWLPTSPPERSPLEDSERQIREFVNTHAHWVIEGSYSDLLQLAIPSANELIFMNLPIMACISNAKNRPWEPHKYESKEAQDANLSMLIDWISQYEEREDTFSQSAHRKLYNEYCGMKRMYTSNDRTT
jgi:adenylate kinase family enzyme